MAKTRTPEINRTPTEIVMEKEYEKSLYRAFIKGAAA